MNISRLFMCIFMICTFSTSALATDTKPPESTFLSNISPEVLAKMTSVERDAVIKALTLMKQPEVKSEENVEIANTVKKVTDSIAAIDSAAVVKSAESIADGIVAFCTKLGIAAGEFVKSPTGGTIFKIASVIYVIKSGMLSQLTHVVYNVFVIGIKLMVIVALLRIIFLANTTKKVTLVTKTYTDAPVTLLVRNNKDEQTVTIKDQKQLTSEVQGSNKFSIINEKDVELSRFNVGFGDSDDSSVYRVVVCVICTVLTLIIIASI